MQCRSSRSSNPPEHISTIGHGHYHRAWTVKSVKHCNCFNCNVPGRQTPRCGWQVGFFFCTCLYSDWSIACVLVTKSKIASSSSEFYGWQHRTMDICCLKILRKQKSHLEMRATKYWNISEKDPICFSPEMAAQWESSWNALVHGYLEIAAHESYDGRCGGVSWDGRGERAEACCLLPSHSSGDIFGFYLDFEKHLHLRRSCSFFIIRGPQLCSFW